jgi:benzaldehyde dehydrogenase (NAD)
MALLDPRVWQGNIFVGGWVKGSGGEYTVTEPATGAGLETLGSATPADVTRASAVAVEAQKEWGRCPYGERAAVLRRAADLWSEHSEEVGGWIIREAGSTGPKAGFETHMATDLCNAGAALTGQPYGQLIRSSSPRLSMTRRLPAGVVGVIAPFNVPLVLAIRYVAPALALGNSVLLKPDPRTAVSGGVTLARVFEEAGLPEGVLSVLPGGADVGQEIIRDPNVSVVVRRAVEGLSPSWPGST